jgi:hypothetical protein
MRSKHGIHVMSKKDSGDGVRDEKYAWSTRKEQEDRLRRYRR